MTHHKTVIALALSALALSAQAQQAVRKPYIIELADAPVVAYQGQVPGLKATRPAAGRKLTDVNPQDVLNYRAYLEGKQSQAISLVPAAKVTYRYKNILNGFAALLTEAEFAKMVNTPGVVRISEDKPMKPDTISTPNFLGLTKAVEGAWNRTDGAGKKIKGEDVIIGHLDGGVWPEDPSFSDKVDPATGKPVASHLPGTVAYGPPPAKWAGICQTGLGFNASHCNNKLIGARYFNAQYKAALAVGAAGIWSGDYFDSPRDADGHGTHTLSTAGGNENVEILVGGSTFTMSGIAPRARVASYKVCYVGGNPDGSINTDLGGCFPSDSAAAADQAVLDGVDVINFSVSGSRTSFNDAVSTAFANAAVFGNVFVTASAGNSGPGNTVAHIGPWNMTVGNSTHDRLFGATLTLGSGDSASGYSFQKSGLLSSPFILSINAGVGAFNTLSDADKLALGRCYNAADRAANGATAAAALDPAKVAGKMVVCVRGGNALINKADAVKLAGGVGTVIQNVPAGLLPAPLNLASANTQISQPYVVPTVHLLAADAAKVVGYAASGTGTAGLSAGVQIPGVVAPVMAVSSSRGPNQGDPYLLKPDITAPGTDIFAAFTNTTITPEQRLAIIAGTLVPGAEAASLTGTSMSSPHVAGAAALVRQANPTWSPFAVKSALMTSALQTVKLGNGAADPDRWGYGAGHLNPNGALDTKGVYDQTAAEHIAYYNKSINGSALNIASMTNPDVLGTASFTRRLTNGGTTAVTYTGSSSVSGYSVSLSPSTLTLAPGQTASYTATVTLTTAPSNTYVFGNITWTAPGQAPVVSPLTLRGSEIVALASATDSRPVGTKVITTAFGFGGSLFTTATGAVPATVASGRVATGELVCQPLPVVPSGAKSLRVQLFNADTEGGAASDIDLFVYEGSNLVDFSLSGTSDEIVTVPNPVAGSTYRACIDGYAPLGGSAAFKVSSWVLGPTSPGTLRAFGPRTVTPGLLASIGLSWSLPAGQRYAGLVEYRRSATAAPIAVTDVFFDTTPSGAAAASVAKVIKNKPYRSIAQ